MKVPRLASALFIAAVAAVATALAACGGGGSSGDLDNLEFSSTHSDGSGTGGTIVNVKTLESAETSATLRFRLFPDVALADPAWTPEPDLDGDGEPDRAWLEDGVLLVSLAGDDAVAAIPIADDAVEVRALVAGSLADLVVLRADGRTDLYVNETAGP